jgi:hypothetical protein
MKRLVYTRGAWSISLLLLACLLLLPACGGDDDNSSADATPTLQTETTAVPATTEKADAPDPTVGGARVACPTRTVTVEFASDSGAAFSADGVLATSAKLRTEPVYGYAEGCKPAGNEGGTVAEPFEVVEEQVTLTCTASTNIEIAGRAAIFDNKPGYELSAAAAGSTSFFVKTHYELRGGTAYLLYAPNSCERK